MFKPLYRTTPYLVSLFEKIAAQAAVIRHSSLKLPVRIHLERDALNRSVHSSTAIEGNRLSLQQVVDLSAKKDLAADQKQKTEVQNCLNALHWVMRNKDSALTEMKLLTLHRLMVKDLLPLKRTGRYRSIQNYIVNAKNIVVFTPPAPFQVSRRMKELFRWLKFSPQEHTIARSAIFHHEFVTIHPFTDGNGRVARAAGQWLLFKEGFDPVMTLRLDEYFAQDRDRYYKMIQQARDLDNDYTHWVEYVAAGVLESVTHAVQRLKEFTRGLKEGKDITLTPKQEEVLNLLKEKGVIGSLEICRAMKINRARVNQLIAPLVEAGLVIREGKTRGSKYSLPGL